MKKNDLLDNPLDDEGITKAAKTGMKLYDWTTNMLWYITIAKWVMVSIVVIGLLWGGYSFVSGLKVMVTDAVVTEVKVVAAEKTSEVKAAVKEKAKGHSMYDLGGAFAKFTNEVEAKMAAAVDGALIENGYHPDAPAICARSPDGNSGCLKYSDTEINGGDYVAISLWDTPCSTAYAEAMRRLKAKGKITENDKRMLSVECQAEIKNSNKNDLEQRKANMLKEAGL